MLSVMITLGGFGFQTGKDSSSDEDHSAVSEWRVSAKAILHSTCLRSKLATSHSLLGITAMYVTVL